MVGEGFKWGGLTIIFGFIAIVAILAIGAMATFGFGLFAKSTANFRGEVNEVEQTKASGSFRIYSYEHFFELCVSAQNKEKAIGALQEELALHPSEGRREQVIADITANKIAREESIDQYNADAQKEKTIGQFKAANLPYELNPNEKETQCR
jgi:hypothetical protein